MGGKDFCFNMMFLDKWRKIYPSAEVHEIQEAGHLVVEDAYEEIIPKMSAFFINNKIN